MIGWVVTGFAFFIKPGYGSAYELLEVRRYALDGFRLSRPAPDWIEVRLLRTTLGDHLLARTDSGWMHLDPVTRQPLRLPDEASIRRLVEDAIVERHARYGEVEFVTGDNGDNRPSATIRTSSGVEINLEWNTLQLQQSGPDTRRIDALYRIHYLQWTGIASVDRLLGLAGLVALLVLTVLGMRLALFARG